MNVPFLEGVLWGAIVAGVGILYATLGEILSEKGGIINLGLEGVMLMGASVGFIVTVKTGSAFAGVVAAMLVGGLFNLILGTLVLHFGANQLASGLTLMFFGAGLSALLGKPFVGSLIKGLQDISIPGLASIPILGKALFTHDILIYLAVPLAVLEWWVLFRTRWGLSLRAVGESPNTAFAAGFQPVSIRFQALFISGLLGGLGGAHLSLAYTKTWAEWMTSGRGFVAVALVIFSKWHPLRAIVGALLFGGVVSLQLQLQARGLPISSFILDMLPYLLTLGLLLVWGGSRRQAAPASLGRPIERR